MLATRNTLIVAVISTIVATIIGTLAALALQRYRFPGYNVAESTAVYPGDYPRSGDGHCPADLLSSSIKIPLGLVTITLSHIAFNIPFVTLVVRARLHGFDAPSKRPPWTWAQMR